jgi:hypothetical protein
MSSSTKRRVQRLEAAAKALGPIVNGASTPLPDDPAQDDRGMAGRGA